MESKRRSQKLAQERELTEHAPAPLDLEDLDLEEVVGPPHKNVHAASELVGF